MLNVIIFLVMNFSAGASAFLIQRRFLKRQNYSDSLQAVFILYLAQIVLTQLVLGIFGILYLSNVILFNLAAFLLVWLLCRGHASSRGYFDIVDLARQVIADNPGRFALSVILVFGIVKVFINLVNPPFGWDSLNYHFTFPVEWLKYGNLDIPPTVFDDPSPSYYPINGSLYYLWLIFPFKSVFLADLGQLPFFILSGLSIYSISKKLGLSKQYSFYAAALFMLIPNFFKQLQIAYVDVMIGGLFLAALNCIFLLKKDFSFVNVLIYALSLGLLVGTKTTAVVYSLLLVIPFIYLTFRHINKSYLFLVVIAALISLGGFSYIRNFSEAHNPLYPLNFNLFGKQVFKGVMDMKAYSAHFVPGDWAIGKLLFHEGLGSQVLIFILPGILLTYPVCLIKDKKNTDFVLTYFLLLPLLAYLAYRYMIPLANSRYLYPSLGAGIAAGFYFFSVLRINRRVVEILVILSVLLSVFKLAKNTELVVSILASFLVFFASGRIRIGTGFAFARLGKLWISLIALAIVCALAALSKYYVKNEFPRYKRMVKYSGFWPDAASAWDWFNNNTCQDNIAYVGRPVPFPLYGSRFKNNVYYVSVNKTEPAKLHYFPDSHYQWGYDFLSLHRNLEAQGNYRAGADYSIWLSNLEKRGTDYLFVYSLHQTDEIMFPFEDTWARLAPDKFSLVFANDTVHIYKLIK